MLKPTKLYVAKLQCTHCGATWKDLPIGSGVSCLKFCGVTIDYDNHPQFLSRSPYVKWLNYDETFGQHHYSDLETWEEAYGKLTNKQIKKLLKKVD